MGKVMQAETISATELRQHMKDSLSRVGEGRCLKVSHHGEEVACIIPIEEYTRFANMSEAAEEAITEALHRLRLEDIHKGKKKNAFPLSAEAKESIRQQTRKASQTEKSISLETLRKRISK